MKLQRNRPCLCVSCPECKSVFFATALDEQFQKDNEDNKRLLNDITRYAKEGYSVEFKDAHEVKLNFCEHIKK